MKIMVAVLVLLSAFSLQAATLDKCFQVKKNQLARIVHNDKFVTVHWNIRSKARVDIESGHVLNFNESALQKSFNTYLSSSAGDGSNFRISYNNIALSFQSLWGTGAPIGNPSIFKFTSCR